MTEANPTTHDGAVSYFQRLSSDYSRQTGDSTYDVVQTFLKRIENRITPSAKVHDNACGVGTAALAILSSVPRDVHPQRIEATDNSEGMLIALKDTVERQGLRDIRAQNMDSTALDFADSSFDLSITNISIANFHDSRKALTEIHRTLEPGGLAVVSAWKRFAVAELIHKAQLRVRPDDVLMKMPNAEFMEEGYLRDRIIEAGFDSSKIEQQMVSTVVRGDAIDGLRSFMTGPMTGVARHGWSDEQVAKWPGAIDEAIEEEKAQHGGIEMVAWFVTAVK